MQLNPVYGPEPLQRIESLVEDPATPLVRQRARLADLLAGLDADQWASPSRCDGWSVQDVIAHLVTTNQFWSYSIVAGLAGKPSQVLAGFDPVATPAQLVASVQDRTVAETLELFNQSNDALATTLEGLDADGWDTLAEAPPGHQSIRLLAMHAIWDSWIHERDIALPLGRTPPVEADEVAASLIYVALLGPAFSAVSGATRPGTLAIRATDPEIDVQIEMGPHIVVRPGPAADGTPTLTGDAVGLVEGLSFRAPFTPTLADEDRWLLGTLGTVFDRTD